VSERGQTAARGLRFESVSYHLAGRTLLRDVSFEVAPGEVVGLLGRNGVGKTTLLRLASRTLQPDAGVIRFDGRAIETIPRRELARTLASVPQDNHVPFPFLAGELVLMGRAPHQGLLGFESAQDLEIAREAMRRVGVEGLANRSVLELSGGERQLVVFARAIAQRPRLLLLDEPTAFLDLRHRIDVLREVRRLASGDRAALVVSHDLGLAARVCDRLLILAGGTLLAQGPPAKVLSRSIIEQAFGIEVRVETQSDGLPIVVPRVGQA